MELVEYQVELAKARTDVDLRTKVIAGGSGQRGDRRDVLLEALCTRSTCSLKGINPSSQTCKRESSTMQSTYQS